MPDYAFFASAPKYMGRLLAEELARLGMYGITEAGGGVQFHGRLEDGYRACLWSRIANRVLLALKETRLGGPDEIYD
ncbi:MAG: THUMP domain-containing protein, partial [Methylohalobius sp.]|nr:THUMP domain-containing protein [Methylohalobius sp.]